MKQRNYIASFATKDGRDVRSFVQIAMCTGQAKVRVPNIVHMPTDDVFDMKCRTDSGHFQEGDTGTQLLMGLEGDATIT